MTTYERPIEATLHVHLANGETWEAEADDLDRFGLVQRGEAYRVFRTTLMKILRRADLLSRDDLTDAALNPVRELAEYALRYPHLVDHHEHEGWPEVAKIERVLQAHADELKEQE